MKVVLLEVPAAQRREISGNSGYRTELSAAAFKINIKQHVRK